ncbi:MAG: ABC transporter permease [Pseudomonadota bacterium]
MKLLLEIAFTHILGRGRQTLVSIVGVAMGVGFAIAMAALMEGGQVDFIDSLVDTMPHVQITDERRTAQLQPAEVVFEATEFRGLRPRDDPRGILNPTAATASLRSWAPGDLAANLSVSAVVRFGGAERGVSVLGVEPRDLVRVSPIEEDMTVGRFEDLGGQSSGVIVGRSLAERLGADPGDSVTITAAETISRRFKIIGVFETGVVGTDERQVYMLLKSAQVLSGRPNAVNDIRIRLNDPDIAPAVAARAEEMLGYKAVSWQEANEAIFEAFEVRNIIMYTVVGAILLVAGFGIYNIVSIITHEKSRDIAILKSLGFTQEDIRRIFLTEGVLMGGVGSVIGWVLGFWLTVALGAVTLELPGQTTEPVNLPVIYSWLHYAIATMFALSSAAVAGYLPARKAAAQNPVEIIRGAT